MDIESFWKDNNKLDSARKSILYEVSRKISWKGRESKLLKRIRSLARNKKFSIRDGKLFNELVSKQLKYGHIDLEKILYYFPGKSLRMIENEYEKRFG